MWPLLSVTSCERDTVSYRAPPAVLPSLRPLDWMDDVCGVYDSRSAACYAIGAARDAADRETRVRKRAATVPCPAFAVDPATALPPMHKVFRYVPPPAVPRHG